MIEDLHLLYPGSAPNLCSAGFVQTLRQVRWAEAWVRYSFLAVGACLLAGLAVLILPAVVPPRYVRLLHLPGAHGRLTASGLIVVTGLVALAVFCLHMYSTLRADLVPYSLPEEVLCRYTLRPARITGFGTWATFGGRWRRFERIHWATEGSPRLTGTTPYVRAILSVWLDYDDAVYIGVDPDGRNPPIFLGATRPAPQVLVERPDDFRALYSALQELFKTSRRWKGKDLLRVWGVAPKGDGSP